MGEILFLAHRMPFPPNRGDKIRSHHVLRHLAELAPVHVATFGDDDDDLAAENELAELAASHCLIRRDKSLLRAGIEALAKGKPVSLTAFHHPALAAYVRKVLAERPIDTIYAFSGQMGQYIPDGFAGRVLFDFVDVDSAKFEAYAEAAGFPADMLYRREARLLSRFERRTALRATTSLLVTPEEAALLRLRMGVADRADVEALGNGIDTEFFDPAGTLPAPEMAGEGPQISFTGQMDYPPNVAAVEMFAREVMPAIRGIFPEARFNVVGRAPSGPVRALDGVNGTRVTGAVLDVRPWIAGADLVVAPLTIARGVQNMVLEAMAMARPVVATPQAATGIPARDGYELLVAEGADALARQALGLLHDPVRAANIGQAARAFVIDHCGWDHVLSPLAGLLGFSDDGGGARVAA